MAQTLSSVEKNSAEQALEKIFFDLQASQATPFLSHLREKSFETFRTIGLPTRRLESWHYTDLRHHLVDVFPLSHQKKEPMALAKVDISPSENAQTSLRLVCEGAHFRPDCSSLPSLPKGISLQSLSDCLAQDPESWASLIFPKDIGADDPLVALNQALVQEGLVLDIAPGVEILSPIEILFLYQATQPQSFVTRLFVRVGAGAHVTLIEKQKGRGDIPFQAHHVCVIQAEEGAQVTYLRLSERSHLHSQTRCIETLLGRLKEKASLLTFSLIKDEPFLRRQTFMRCEGAQTSLTLTGLSLLRQSEHADNTLVVDHLSPGGQSREKFKHIIEGEATGVFQGKICVAPQAQKTDGRMKSQALLLSDTATMYNKPELEIFADDVICGHGATCGPLDHDQLFYLMTRGLPRKEAEALVLEAFALDVLENMEGVQIPEDLTKEIRQWLSQRII